MSIDRRFFLSSLGAMCLSACAPDVPRAQQLRSNPTPPDLLPVPNARFDAWVTGFRPRALASGISSATFDAAFSNAGYIPGVVTRDRTQIQTRRTFEEYLSIATSAERLSKGRTAIARHSTALAAIEQRFGVSRYIIAAIWGMESTFGERRGTIPTISATATLTFEGRRASFYRQQLIAALRILQRGETTPQNLTGSWAGAMGHTQFIPTSYEQFAIDFNGDGRRDVWRDDPSDALASTANYLSRNGWRAGLSWGREAVSGTLQPQSPGPRFTVTRNFNTLKRYNNSDFYALSVGILADRLAGAGPLQTAFGPDANGLTANDRIALQTALTNRGYDIGTIDGVIGTRTEAAIRAVQRDLGMPITGRPSRALLNALR